jgi:hypothetical protein
MLNKATVLYAGPQKSEVPTSTFKILRSIFNILSRFHENGAQKRVSPYYGTGTAADAMNSGARA